MKRNKAKQQQTELWSKATMQQVGTVPSALLWSVMWSYTNDTPLFVRKLRGSWQFLSIKRFTPTCKMIVKITFDGIRANRSLVLYCFSGNKFQRID